MRVLPFLALLLAAPAFAKPEPAWAPPDPLVDDYNRIVDALNAENPAEAERLAERLVAKAPDCGMALLVLGEARARGNRPADALAPLKHAAKLFPNEAVAHASLGSVAFGAQEFVLAEVESGVALTLAPTDVSMAATAVMTSLRLGNMEEAKARLARAQIADRERACIDVTIRSEAGDEAAATAQYAACQGSSEASLVAVAAASLAALTGKDSDAFRKSSEVLGLSGYALVEKGEGLLRAGRWAEAAEVLEAARIALPSDVAVRINLAIALVELERWKEAEGALEAAVASDTWVTVHASGNMSGITTKRSEENLRTLQRQAAALLVRVQAHTAKPAVAKKTLADARARFGDVMELLVAEAQVAVTDGRPADAWALLRAGAARGTGDADLARAIAGLAVAHPEGLDAATIAYVHAHGGTIDRLNLAFAENNRRNFPACVDEIDAVLTKDPLAPRAAEAGYACAVLAGQFDRASSLLGLVGKDAKRM